MMAVSLSALNQMPVKWLREALTTCCGSSAWVDGMVSIMPVGNREELYEQAERIWYTCSEQDWREAFTHHPKIGDIDSLQKKFASTQAWTEGEQAGVSAASQQVLEQLADGNRLYEEKFGYIFIVCATGKSATEMLEMLHDRLPNSPADELKVAMQEQRKITRIRLEKLMLA